MDVMDSSYVIAEIVMHTSFREMKSNKMVNWQFLPEALDQNISKFTASQQEWSPSPRVLKYIYTLFKGCHYL